ncbi:ATP-binding protein [uncultured Desulfosarcina sp.]|uniref:PAS domain-containing hybrid sensor histidine kinase/response regulator n=1 Tax=uncultured Desulfosarcina sp. TaxID=218289 RepID=UPI0029C76EA7|nr:ATP-binding protein [uncultured Desulfosarcina sp.]
MTTTTLPKTIDAVMVCPVTGLPVKSRSEWTDRQFGSRYRLTTRVVGDRILLNQPAGHADLKDIIKSLRMTDAVVREHINPLAGYVYISDYSGMRGISREARKHYIRHMEQRENMLGLIYFGVSPLFRVMIKLAKRLSLVKFNVQIARDYHAAMSAAMRLTGIDPVRMPPGESAHRLRDAGCTEHYENGRHILRCDRWRLKLDGYSLVVEVIDRSIYHAISSGTLRAHHVAPVNRLRERIRRTVGLEDGFCAIVTGTADAHASGRNARKQYMASLKQWHRQYPMALYVFYNANWFIRTAAMLAIPYLPFKVKVARDIAGALALVDRYAGPLAPEYKDSLLQDETVAEDPLHVVHQLLQFIGDIDWERPGAPTADLVNEAHPFRPVFDAIALIKGELDGLFDERGKAEKALRESQQRFDEVLKHSRDILFKRDLQNGRYEYVSDAITDLLGVTPDEVRRMGFGGIQTLVHPEDLSRFLDFNRKMLKIADLTNADPVIEYRLRDRQGRYRWFSDSHALVRDAEGKPAFVIGSNRDITDQKAAERDLKQAYERFITVLDSISAHIYVADLDTFEILFMNRAMRDDFGDYQPGDRCFEIFRKATDVCPHCSNDKLLDAHGQPTGIQTWEGVHPVNQRWYLNHDQAIRWVDGRLVRLQISMDITRIKALETERQEIADRLRHTRKLEAVSTMAGGVAHNFNNLLMVVLGNLELMRMHAEAGSSLSRRIDAAEKSAQRAADLSTLMLTYVGQTRISPHPVDLNAILSEMVDVLKTSVAEQATLITAPASPAAWILADGSKVCQVITNLVTNAVEASGDQPLEIHFSVGRQTCDSAQLFRLAPNENLPEGDYVWLRVSDNGRGMDQETLEKVFDPFFTTKFTGRGLGMAAVMGIMRAHRGGVRIDSRPDAGTAVTVYFPERKQAEPAVSAGPATPVRAHAPNRGTALLVDDEPLVLELGEQMLAFLGFDVLTATDGLEALKVFAANRERIRLTVLDVNMPRMGGRETLARLRGINPSLPILAASGFTEAQTREKLGDARVEGCIKKPFRVDQLRDKIDAILRPPAE